MKLDKLSYLLIGATIIFITCKKDETLSTCENSEPNEYAHFEGNFYVNVSDNWGYGQGSTSLNREYNYDLVVKVMAENDSLKGPENITVKIDSLDQTFFYKYDDNTGYYSTISFSDDYSEIEMHISGSPSSGVVKIFNYDGYRSNLQETIANEPNKPELSGDYMLDYTITNTEEGVSEISEDVFSVYDNENGIVELNGEILQGTSNFLSYRSESTSYQAASEDYVMEIWVHWANDSLQYSFNRINNPYSQDGLNNDTINSTYSGTKLN